MVVSRTHSTAHPHQESELTKSEFNGWRRATAVARRMFVMALGSLLLSGTATAQSRGAAALEQMVDGLGTSGRVLMIAAHPDDEDTNLIAWLARGRHVETAYLSLTRGDGGQNLIGNELGEALGVIRTEELLAARRVDGGQQYFTRAFDFGFSKSAEETFEHWPHDTILGDVVRVVRQFRPHVIVAVFSGTPRDGHGHHQASGILALEAYKLSADTARFPRKEFGEPWTPLKLYRSARFNRVAGTLEIPVGEYDPVLGRSFAEIAGESRSQHSSQGFGALQRKGPVTTWVAREESRVEAGPAADERSLFDGVDTTWTRFAGFLRGAVARAALDSLPAAFAAAREGLDLRRPQELVPTLLHVRSLLDRVCQADAPDDCGMPDLASSLRISRVRTDSALRLATGVALEAEATRTVSAIGEIPATVVVRIYNRGLDTVTVGMPAARLPDEGAVAASAAGSASSSAGSASRVLPPREVAVDTITVDPEIPTEPWWLRTSRVGDLFAEPVRMAESARTGAAALVSVPVTVNGTTQTSFELRTPVVYRYVDPVRGDMSIPLAAAPAITVRLDRETELARAGTDLSREVRVRLQSADTAQRSVVVRITLPEGLVADSASRTVSLPAGAERSVRFRVSGRVEPGAHEVRAVAESDGRRYDTGYELVNYEHIRPQRMYRPAVLRIQAVDVRVPEGLRVAYIPGVGDNVAPTLQQLGVSVNVLDPSAIATANLTAFDAVVVGPRAYESSEALLAANPRLLAYARGGGTLVVQYQQYELNRGSILPYPVQIARPHDRVTLEDAPVRILDPEADVLRWPNAIGSEDFEGWVQERSLYMPREFDERYTPLLEMSDPGEPANRGSLLVAPYGRGRVVYTSLALFRQLPAGVPGAARLMVNLVSAGGRQ